MPTLPTGLDLRGTAAPRPGRDLTQIDSRAFEAPGRAMQEVSEIISRETQRLEDLAAENAINRLRERRLDLTVGEQHGFTKIVGEEAVIKRQLLREFPEQFDRAATEIGGTLPTARARSRFTQLAETQRLGFKTELARHVAEQTEVFNKQVYEDTIRTEASYMASNYGDQEALFVSMNRLAGAVQQRAVQMGVDPKSTEGRKRVEVMYQEAVGTMTVAAVQGALANENPRTAKRIFEQNERFLTAEQKNRILPALRAGESWEVGKGLGEQMIGMAENGVSRTEILAYARKNADNKDAMNTALSVFGQWDAARQNDRVLAGEDVRRRLNDGESWFKIRSEPGVLAALDPDSVAALDAAAQKAARGESVQTDFVIWTDVRNEIERAAALGHPPIDLTPLIGHISTADLKSLDEKQYALRNNTDSVPDAATLTQQISTALGELRINSRRQPQRAAQLEKYVRDRVDAENRRRAAGRQPPLNYTEREEIIRDALRVEVEGRWFRSERRAFEMVEPAPGQPAPDRTEAQAVPVPDNRPRATVVPPLTPIAPPAPQFESDIPTPSAQPSDIVTRPNYDAQGREILLPPEDFSQYILRKRPGITAQEVYDLWAEYQRRTAAGGEQ